MAGNRRTKFFQNKEVLTGIYLVVAAVLILMLASRSSFLYPCNDWNDANSYFSVGKALFNGKMPYRDVFDQKGMYLYFFYGLSYLVSHTTFAGVFLLEIILAVFDLWAIYRILKMFLKDSTALVLTPLVLTVSFTSFSFYWGGSAEEVCMPFLLWGLYQSVHYFKHVYPQKTMDAKNLFIGGVLAGVVANIKFTILGFFFAWIMFVAFSFLGKKDFKGGIKACLIFLLGMFVPFFPWIIYFAIHQGLYEWYWGYIYINVFVYSNLNGNGPGIGERIYTLAKLLYWIIRQNFVYFAFVIPGVICSMFQKKTGMLARFCTLCQCFFLFLGIYIGGAKYPYYALPLSIFAVLGFVAVGMLWEKISAKWKKEMLPGGSLVIQAVSLAVCMVILFTTSMNISFMSQKQEDYFLYKFKEIVDETPDATLLNIGCLDAGLYTVCDIVPTCRWFQTQTLAIDDVLESQERYIREGQITYVLARDSYPEVIWEKYELVGEEDWFMEEEKFTYYLFRLKEV